MAVLTAVAPERESFIASSTVSGTITVRKSCYAMTPEEIGAYRLAVSRIATISAAAPQDNRGFQYIAGLHGLPGRYCKHGEPGFALWHRAYVQGYEQRLQDVVPEAFVPYWDWSTRRAESEGIPGMFSEQTWENPDTGETERNPLLSQPMLLVPRGGQTARNPGSPAQLLSLRALFQQSLLAPDYFALTADLENPHNQLHGWVGGSMSTIDTAAYDPIFWSHHAFVEYGFCQWQDAHPEAALPAMDPRDFAPFSVTIDDVWNYHDLGYAYEPDNASELRPAGVRDGPGASAANSVRSRATVAHFPLYTLDRDFSRADVRFEGLTPPVETFGVRVFADQPGADANTPTDENPNYLGTRYFFGHGECGGTEGHCDPIPRDIFDLRPRHHYAPVHVRLNVTRRLKDFIHGKGPTANNPAGDATISLVIVDPKGNEVHDPGLHFEGLSFVVR